MSGLPSFAVIIPALNEAVEIADCVRNARKCLPTAEVIVVDGGSEDDTAANASDAGARVVQSERGRGIQCATGAEKTSARNLIFLHADTRLPPDAGKILARQFANPDASVATFRLKFQDGSLFLRLCAWCTRFDSVFTRFGDQAIVIRSDFYRALGGFPPWPLFEDVELLRRARRLTRVHSLASSVTTSSRRFQRRGPLRQQLQNGLLLTRYLLGSSPHQLAAEYRPEPPRSKGVPIP